METPFFGIYPLFGSGVDVFFFLQRARIIVIIWGQIKDIEQSSKSEMIIFAIKGFPPLDFPRYMKNWNIFYGRRWKFFFRPISDTLYYRGSKNTNLMSGEFCKGKPVTPATCVKVKSGSKNGAQVQNLTICKKIHIFCPILMKLGENNHLMR